MVALIRSWPSLVRRIILLLGLVATSTYIDFVQLDIDGSQIRDFSTLFWTDFEEPSGKADLPAQAAILAGMPLKSEKATFNETAGGDCYCDKPPVQ